MTDTDIWKLVKEARDINVTPKYGYSLAGELMKLTSCGLNNEHSAMINVAALCCSTLEGVNEKNDISTNTNDVWEEVARKVNRSVPLVSHQRQLLSYTLHSLCMCIGAWTETSPHLARALTDVAAAAVGVVYAKSTEGR